MKKLLIYSILALAMVACTDAPDAPSGGSDRFEMHFLAYAGTISRANDKGVYNDTIYPVDDLYLTAYLTDQINEKQYYFTDMKLDYDSETGEWSASNWYWPMQGEMTFISYWSPKVSGTPAFDEYVDAEGVKHPRVTVDATQLDGYNDFLYLSQTGIKCPQPKSTRLLFRHGLAWITISLRAEGLDAGGTSVDSDKTIEIINKVRIYKVVIEDCARCGIASIVPGVGLKWKTTNDKVSPAVSYVKDQVYSHSGYSFPNLTYHNWVEYDDADECTPVEPLILSSRHQSLGYYAVTSPHTGGGLLIVPQKKTAITIDYTVLVSDTKTVTKHVRYELSDNDDEWLPGAHYDYDIVFRNFGETTENFEVIPTWSGVIGNALNECYDDVTGTFSAPSTGSLNSGFIIEPIHGGGSGFGDDMDYPEGPVVF